MEIEIIKIAKRKIKVIQKSKSVTSGVDTVFPIKPPSSSPARVLTTPSPESKKNIAPVVVAAAKFGPLPLKNDIPRRIKSRGKIKYPIPNNISSQLNKLLPTTPALLKDASIKNIANTKKRMESTQCLVSSLRLFIILKDFCADFFFLFAIVV